MLTKMPFPLVLPRVLSPECDKRCDKRWFYRQGHSSLCRSKVQVFPNVLRLAFLYSEAQKDEVANPDGSDQAGLGLRES